MKLEANLAAQLIKDILDHEGNVPWPYCDVRGYVTIGVGHLVKDGDALCALPLVHAFEGHPATEDEKRRAFTSVHVAFHPELEAIAYRRCSDLRLPRPVAVELARGRLEEEFIPSLLKLFHDLLGWPLPALRAVVDIAYNCGIHWGSKFPSLVAACQERKWSEAAKHCTRAAARRPPTPEDPEGLGPRNRWTIKMFREAATSAAVSQGTTAGTAA